MQMEDTGGEHPEELTTSEQTYLPGTASLVQEIDKRLLIMLRDGKTLIGYLRSVDQFDSLTLHMPGLPSATSANLLLQDTVERIHVGRQYGDIPRGIYLVRGENVVLCGEIDSTKEQGLGFQQVSIDDILEAQRVKQEAREEERRKRDVILQARGMRPQDKTEDAYS